MGGICGQRLNIQGVLNPPNLKFAPNDNDILLMPDARCNKCSDL